MYHRLKILILTGGNVAAAAANVGVPPAVATGTLGVGLTVIVAISAATVTGLIFLTAMLVLRRLRKRRRKRENADGNTTSGFVTRYNNTGDSGWFGSTRSFASTDTNSPETSGVSSNY